MVDYQIGDEVLSGWKIVRLIGEGAFGKVFEVQKPSHRIVRSALKVVVVPPSRSMVDDALSQGMDESSVADYFHGIVDDFLREIDLLSSLSHPGVVDYKDHEVLRHDDGLGWDILLRMELLQPLTERLKSGVLPQSEVARLGKELSDALAFCHGRGIIHRDVKPANAFVDGVGRYKLGDFGVARTAEHTVGALSRKGTEDYMAPEVYRGEPYGPSADVYSLGVMLYQLLNGNRLPFSPPAPAPVSFRDREQARSRRLAGEALPIPDDCLPSLYEVVRAACAPNPAERPTAAELRELLARLDFPADADADKGPRPEPIADTDDGGRHGAAAVSTVGVWGPFAQAEREAAERHAAEEAAQEQAERERLEREQTERERQERERLEREQAERERAERERAEAERLERERRERERLEQERIAREQQERKDSAIPSGVIIGIIVAVVAAVAIIAALSLGSGTPESSSSSSDYAQAESGGDVVASDDVSDQSSGETADNSISRVGDIGGLDRAERAKLFAMIAASWKIADDSGDYVDYAMRDEDLSRLVSSDYSDASRISSMNYKDPIVSEQAYVLATKGDVYYVVADETLVASSSDAADELYVGPEEIVVVFDDDDMVARAYDLDDYFDVMGYEGTDYAESYPISREGEVLSPSSDNGSITFETDDFSIQLPGEWTLKRNVPSVTEKVFGLENDGYYFWNDEQKVNLEVGVETFGLETYTPATYLHETIGFSSSGKQVTLWFHSDIRADLKQYAIEHTKLK